MLEDMIHLLTYRNTLFHSSQLLNGTKQGGKSISFAMKSQRKFNYTLSART